MTAEVSFKWNDFCFRYTYCLMKEASWVSHYGVPIPLYWNTSKCLAKNGRRRFFNLPKLVVISSSINYVDESKMINQACRIEPLHNTLFHVRASLHGWHLPSVFEHQSVR
jgi:hypothetical protein